VTERAPLEPRAIAAVFVAGFAARLPWLARVEQDVDGVRFVGAVLRFDVERMHPHPPGYPVYVAPAIALHRALGLSPAVALSTVSALGGALCAASLYALARAWGSARATALAWALLGSALPGLALLSTRPGSDALGLGLAMLAYALVARGTLIAALSALSALSLLAGARHSLFALVLPAAVLALSIARRERALSRAVVVCAASLCAWLGPLLAVQGARSWWRALTVHAHGHFTDYGGTLLTERDLPSRLGAFVRALATQGLFERSLASWASITLSLLVCVGVYSTAREAHSEPSRRALFAGTALYALWVLLAQNVLWAPRHALAALPALAWLAVEGLAALGRVRRVAGALVSAALCLALSSRSIVAMRAQSEGTPAGLCLARALPTVASARGDLVASAQVAHWVRFRQPEHRVLWVPALADARRIAEQNGWGLVVSSETPGVTEALAAGAARVVTVCESDPRAWPTLPTLAWVRVR
jgi:hypothetical protein